MSFRGPKDTIEYEDTVLLHINFDRMLPLIVKKGETHQTKFGAVRHDQLVGKRYGTKFQCQGGWIYLVQPTPELWTVCLPHRTQILYSTDISMVIFQLDIKPGSVVVESGTGSGSLSHSIIRAVMPKGHLHTFEFHEERSCKAREEFVSHGLSEFVTVTHRDVCADGFQLKGVADAVFLDLPRPWECVASAKEALKDEGGRICSFSPCIEQVQRTCEELTKQGFEEITTVECLLRNYMIQNVKLPNIDFDGKKDETSIGDEVDGSDDRANDSCAKSKRQEVAEQKSKVIGTDSQGSKEIPSHCFTSAVPNLAAQGHSGFLTFGTLFNKY